MRRQAVTDLLLGKEKTNKKVERKFNVFDSSPHSMGNQKAESGEIGEGRPNLIKEAWTKLSEPVSHLSNRTSCASYTD